MITVYAVIDTSKYTLFFKIKDRNVTGALRLIERIREIPEYSRSYVFSCNFLKKKIEV